MRRVSISTRGVLSSLVSNAVMPLIGSGYFRLSRAETIEAGAALTYSAGTVWKSNCVVDGAVPDLDTV